MSEVIDTIPQYKLKNPWAKDVFVLLQCGVSIGIAPTGTMGANGAVTLGTALNTTYSGGVWLYYPAGAAYSGSAAGFYWTVMSSTTAGTVYTNTYVPGTSSFDIPASPTAVVDAGPGAFTGVTSEITAISVTVPGGLMGKHGSLRWSLLFTHNNSANNKVLTHKFGAVSIATSTRTTTTTSRESNCVINAGRADKQIANGGGVAFADGNTTVPNPSIQSIDTGVDKVLSFTLTHGTATDFATLDRTVVEVLPS